GRCGARPLRSAPRPPARETRPGPRGPERARSGPRGISPVLRSLLRRPLPGQPLLLLGLLVLLQRLQELHRAVPRHARLLAELLVGLLLLGLVTRRALVPARGLLARLLLPLLVLLAGLLLLVVLLVLLLLLVPGLALLLLLLL